MSLEVECKWIDEELLVGKSNHLLDDSFDFKSLIVDFSLNWMKDESSLFVVSQYYEYDLVNLQLGESGKITDSS